MISGKKEATLFPRGGPAKKKKVHKEGKVTRDPDLFSIRPDRSHDDGTRIKKKGGKKKDVATEEDDPMSVKQIETLSYDDLSEGFTMLACVSVIKDLELKLSLPGRMTATVPITNISRPYTDALKRVAENESDDEDEDFGIKPLSSMFKQGQLVICSVVSVDKKDTDGIFYKVTASLSPHVIQGGKLDPKKLQGIKLVAAVKSLEEYGYTMDIGLQGVHAFLPKKKVEKYVNEYLDSEPLTVGQLVPCVVTQLNGPAAKLSAEPGKLRSYICNTDKVTVHSMLPGLTFEGEVDAKPIKNGIKINFGDLTGYVHYHHLNKDISEYEAGDSVTAQVLYVSPTINTVYLSLKDFTKSGAKPVNPFASYKIGDLVNNVQIKDVGSKGLTVKLDEINFGFVPIKQISDSKVAYKDLKKDYPKGSIKPNCRIIQFDYIDQHFICSFQKSLLKPDQSVITADSLKPGDKVSCKIKSFVNLGVIVEVGTKQLEGFIPHLHLTDVPMTHPEKKFSPGDKLKCRVLKTDPNKRKLHLTSKPILVKKVYDIVDTYDQSNMGKTTEGVVVKLTPQGILLQLFGDVRGFVPKSKISVDGVEHPEKLFFLGQALKCQVVEIDSAKDRMILSLILNDENFKPLGKKEKAMSDHLRLGSFYTCKVDSISSDGLNVLTIHVKREEEPKPEEKLITVKCFIPTMHLTDHPVLAPLLLSTFNIGDIIEAVCFEKDAVPILTMKPSICEYAQSQPPKNFADLHEGMILPCVVNLVKNFGAFLRLPSWRFRKSALVPTRHLADFFVENPRDLLQTYQTLYGKIIEKDEEKQTITMTSRRKEVLTDDTSHSVQMISSFFNELLRIRQNPEWEHLEELRPGIPVTCIVTEVSDLGLETNVKGVRGIIPRSALNDNEDYKVGTKLSAVVVFVDYQFSCVELCPDPDFVRHAVQALGKNGPREGSKVKAKVVLKRSSPFFYVSMVIINPNKFAGQLVHVPTRQHINDTIGHTDSYNLGDINSVIIKKSGDYPIGILEKHDKVRKRVRKDSIESAAPAAKKSRNESNESIDVTMSPVKKSESDESILITTPTAKKSRTASNDSIQITSPVAVKEEEEVKVEIKLEDPGWEIEYNPWGIGLNKEKSEEQDVTMDDSTTKSKKAKTHLSKKEKKELDRLESEEIAKAEQRVLDGEEAEPETADEFDRLVLASPNSSLCWIKYMAFYISKNNQETARGIAKRALEKIHFREEAERLNVYLAWFNMENSSKNEEEAEKVFKDSLKCNDQYSVYQRVAAVYSQSSDQSDKAENIYKIMARRFCKEPEVWTQLGQFYFKNGNLKDARFTLQRSLQNLEAKHHVDISSKFAQMEFKLGEAERGKTIFENIISNYPRRTDQWSVYADMVIKKGEVDAAREIFDRMIQLNLQPKKMKFFFKKYLEFEEAQGDPIRIDQVRKKALEYVESKFGVTDVDPVEHLDSIEN